MIRGYKSRIFDHFAKEKCVFYKKKEKKRNKRYVKDRIGAVLIFPHFSFPIIAKSNHHSETRTLRQAEQQPINKQRPLPDVTH